MNKTTYVAKQPDSQGLIHYTDSENQVWQTLYERQIKLIQNRACSAFIEGLELIGLNSQKIPQCKEVSIKLNKLTGWEVVPVEALISYKEFFKLLSERKFPAASFIRIPEELDYLMEPDIFHEIFGHAPMLTNPAFAKFAEQVGKLGVTADKADRAMLARLFWFTVEFGLINTEQGLRIYGAGILSSKGETVYALESATPNRQKFDLMTLLCTPYRYDEIQLNYFVINDFNEFYKLIDIDLLSAFATARKMGMLPNPHTEDLSDQRSC